MATENKVNFGLKNVHYAIWDDAKSEYGTPVAVPGAVSLSLTAKGDTSEFYADNGVYYATAANQGYEGDIEVARIPEQMLTDLLGYKKDTKNVIVEMNTLPTVNFALMYQIEGDQTSDCYVLYMCTATRPNFEASTIEEQKEVKTATFSLTAAPCSDGKVYARTAVDTDETSVTNWFKSVYTPSFSS